MRRLLTILILTLCTAPARAQTPQNALGHAVLYGDANGQATNSWTNLFNVLALGTVQASNVTAQNITLGGVTLSVWPSGGGGGGGSDNFSSLFDTNGSSQIDLSAAGYAAITNALSARVIALGTASTNFTEAATNALNTSQYALESSLLNAGTSGSNYAATLSTNGTNWAVTLSQNATNFANTVGANDTNFAKGVGTSLTNDLANYVLTSALGTAAYSNAPVFASETALLAAGTSLSNDLGNYVLTSALGTAAYSNSPVFASETALLAAGTSLSNDLGNYTLISSLGTIAYSNANQFQQTNTTLTGYASIPTNNMVMTNGANDVDFYTAAAYPLTVAQSGPTNTFGLNSLLTLMTNGNANALTNFSLTSASTNGVQTNWFYGFTNTGSALVLTSNLPAAQLTGLVPTANEGSGSATSSTYLRGDRTWATPGGGGTVTSIGMAVDALGLLSGWSPSTITGSGTFTPTFSGFILTNNFAAAASFNTNVFTGGTNESTNGYIALGGKFTGLGTGLTNASGVAYNTGTVTSVAAASDTLGFVSWSGSPITGGGTLTPTFAGFILTNNEAATANFQTNVTIGGTNFSTNGFVAVGGIISGLGSGITNAAGNGYVDRTITNGVNTSLLNAGNSVTNVLNTLQNGSVTLSNLAANFTVNAAGQITNTAWTVFTNTFANIAVNSNGLSLIWTNGNSIVISNNGQIYTNGALLSGGSGGGVTVAAGTNITLVTNGTTVTVNASTNPSIGLSGVQGTLPLANLPSAVVTNGVGWTNSGPNWTNGMGVFDGWPFAFNITPTGGSVSMVVTNQFNNTSAYAILWTNGPTTNTLITNFQNWFGIWTNGTIRAFLSSSVAGNPLSADAVCPTNPAYALCLNTAYFAARGNGSGFPSTDDSSLGFVSSAGGVGNLAVTRGNQATSLVMPGSATNLLNLVLPLTILYNH